ncbi:MAG: hypothetical protein JSU92_10475 [Deltaproteobacteria bacterium]|nr:MAG: hypothetical protein JSU92_10475 [Deltaproteobacteria bacterium]
MKRVLICVSVILISTGCSIKRMAVNSMVPTFGDLTGAAYKQVDTEILRHGMPFTIILIDGLLELSPNNRDLLVIAAQAYGGYPTAFIDEDEDPERAKRLYVKGRDYGLRALKLNKKFRKTLEEGKRFREAVQYLDEKYIPAMFWTAQNWAAWLSLSTKNVSALFDQPKIIALMERVMELDDTYYYGGVHLFYALYYANMPPMAGGGMDKAQAEFDKVFEFAGENFLMANFFYAQYYAAPLRDEALFDRELKKVLETPSDVEPELTFMNEVAKLKAKKLLNKKNRIF